jgi:hypothetical protein
VQQKNLREVEQRLSELSAESADEPQFFLYIYLAAAFRDIGLPDKASEIYQNLLALDDSSWSQSALSREGVEQALEALNE